MTEQSAGINRVPGKSEGRGRTWSRKGTAEIHSVLGQKKQCSRKSPIL